MVICPKIGLVTLSSPGTNVSASESIASLNCEDKIVQKYNSAKKIFSSAASSTICVVVTKWSIRQANTLVGSFVYRHLILLSDL